MDAIYRPSVPPVLRVSRGCWPGHVLQASNPTARSVAVGNLEPGRRGNVGPSTVTNADPPGRDARWTTPASRAAEDFNRGLRAFYFALAAIAWFFHPWLSVAGSALVLYILYQRDFRSRTLHALAGPSTANLSLQLPESAWRELRPNARGA